MSWSNYTAAGFDEQLTDLALSPSLAGNPSCVGDDLDAPQSFGKNRRANTCRSPPQGSENHWQESQKNTPSDPLSWQQFLNDQLQVEQFFPQSEELCPARIFHFSTIPVCINGLVTIIRPQPPLLYSNLWNVMPGAYVGVQTEFGVRVVNHRSLLIQFAVVFPGETTCPPDRRMWCCADIVKSVSDLSTRMTANKAFWSLISWFSVYRTA